MSFTKLLKGDKNDNENNTISKDVIQISENSELAKNSQELVEKEKKPQEILRGANFKIKLVTPTSFGTQIDFAKKYDDEDIEKVLKDFTIKIKNKSVFIVD